MSVNVDVTYNNSSILTLSNQSSVPITYDGNTIATLSSAGTKTLLCADKYMTTNVGIGSSTLNCAGKIMASNVVVTATNAQLVIYDSGTTISGGLTYKNINSASVSFQSSNIRYKGTYDNSRAAIYQKNKYDTTPYTTMTVKYKMGGSGNIMFGIASAVSSTSSAITITWVGSQYSQSYSSSSSYIGQTLTRTLNVSSINGDYYVVVRMGGASQNYIYQIILS